MNRNELTAKEKLRAEKIAAKSAELEADGFRKTNLTVSMGKVQITAILLWLVYSVLFGLMYLWFNNMSGKSSMREKIIFIVTILVLIVVHELIHGFTWSFFVKDRKSIEFGFARKTMTPYCACTEPLTKGQYILSGFMPCLVLGIIPSLISVFVGSRFLYYLGNFMFLGAGGDLTVIIKLLKYKSSAKNQLILDHPSECGCLIFEK